MVKFLRGKAASILITGGILVGAVLIARRFNLGGTISEGAFGLGQTAGNVITQPIAGLTNTLAGGIFDIANQAKLLFESLGSAGADVQGAFTGNRNAIGDFFSGNQSTNARENRPLPSQILAAGSENNPLAVINRLETFRSRTNTSGFSSFQEAETALQKALRESKEKFPQFFN